MAMNKVLKVTPIAKIVKIMKVRIALKKILFIVQASPNLQICPIR